MKKRTTFYIMTLFSNHLLIVIVFDLLRNYNFVFADDTENQKCKEKILISYPDAKCSLAKDPEECKSICGKYGKDKCKETKGEIKKLHCKNSDANNNKNKNENSNDPDLMTCCCSITCANSEETQKLLGNVNYYLP